MWLVNVEFSIQESETTDQCAARLKATSTGSRDTNDGWSSIDALVCVDSTWQQVTSIMKVKNVSTKSRKIDLCHIMSLLVHCRMIGSVLFLE